jgi:5'-3' exonuclease
VNASSLVPPWVNDPSALVIVDWSWWLHKAYALRDIDMSASVVGWLCNLLAYNPAHLCLALDSGGPTFRHRMQHPTNPEWRYKAGRPPKPPEFHTLCARITEIAELHAIPCLWANDYEGDDIAATVTRQARACGYRVWNCTADKDLAALVESDPDPKIGIVSGMWDNSSNTWRGPAEVVERFGVQPHQIADWLAIMGDKGDNVPGVDGLGADKAADLLMQFGTLDAALARDVWTLDELAACDAKIKGLTKPAKTDPAAKDERAAWMHLKRVAGYHAVLRMSADVARFSRSLTALDCDAPIDIPWNDLPVGGFDHAALTDRYRRIGYTRKAAQVADFPKPAPWSTPWQ